MIKIVNKEDCCGCNACVQKCPKHCITMKEDHEGFLYPMVNESFCIDCKLCETVCPVLNVYQPIAPVLALAAYNKDRKVRLESSSGGIFTLLSERVIAEGGVVFGARFNDQWQVEIGHTDTTDGIEAFRGSKYIQATVGKAYKEAKAYLDQGLKVLFSGTPCQIAGLNRYLQKSYENLLTVDVVCHGVPSPKVWKYYLSEITNNAVLAINSCFFRNKENGWKRFNFQLKYISGGEFCILSSYHQENHFMRAFLNNMILRPSCYACRAKGGRSHSDITIADFWGVEYVIPAMDDDKGIGLVLVNSLKGQQFLGSNLGGVFHEVDFEHAIKHNSSWGKSVTPHPHRAIFFKKIDKKKSIVGLIENELLPSMTWRQRMGRIKARVKQIIKQCWGGGNSFIFL